MNKPNVLWICTDQQRYDTLSSYGNELLHTPHLDRLAERGVLFKKAFCQNPLCTPSRASFLTGRYPRTTRCRQNGQSIPADEKLITRMFAEQGYQCGLAGKLHLSACHPSVTPLAERRIEDGYSQFHWSHHPSPFDPIDWPENEYSQWLRQQGSEFQVEPFTECSYVQIGMPAELHQTTWCAEKAIEFIEDAGRHPHVPWFFSVNMFDPHHPFDPPKEYLQYFLNRLEELNGPNYEQGELDGKPRHQQVEHHMAYCKDGFYPFARMKETDHHYLKAAYYAMIQLIDDQVGRILASLEASGQLANTIVLFMSDHGEMLGDHGIYLKGPHFYDSAVRVPLIMSMPGTVRSAVRSEALIELVDLAPTLWEAIGGSPDPGMQGKSLWKLLTTPDLPDEHREDVYSEYYNSGFKEQEDPCGPFATMLRTDSHKLVVHHNLELGELYDLQGDPSERHNLWESAGHQTIKLKLMKRLCDRMAWTVDPLPLRQSPW